MTIAPLLGYMILPDGSAPVLAGIAARLQAAGLRVGGAVQVDVPGPVEGCPAAMRLDVLPHGGSFAISQPVGARGCRLDPGGLEAAAAAVLAGLAARPQIVVLSKFGRHEASGRGLAVPLAAAVGAGIPVLTTVSAACLPAFRAFAGDMATALTPDAAEGWALAQACPPC